MVHSEPAKPTLTNEPAPQDPGASAHSTILRGAAALAGGELIARATAFAATAVLTRRLGPAGFGVLGFASALSGYLLLAVNSGLHDIGTREVARAPDRAVHVYSSVATIRLLLAAAAFLVLAVAAWALPKPIPARLVVLLTGLSLFSFAIDPSWVFKGLERAALASFAQILAQAVFAIGVIAMVHGSDDVVEVPVIQFGGELVAALILCAVLFRHAKPTVTVAAGMDVLRGAGYLSLARFLRAVTISFDMVLLGFVSSDLEVGLYAAAYRVAFLLMSFASAIAAAYMPSYARVVLGPGGAIRSLVETSTTFAVTVAAPLVVGVALTAAPLLALLFGMPYAAGAKALQLLAISVGAVFLHSLVGNILVAQHRTRLQAAINGAAAAVNIALNILLIPRWGITGAAAATLVAELTVSIAGVVVLVRMNALPSARSFVPPLTAAAVMGGAVWASDALPVLARILLGGVVYTTALAACGGIPVRVVRQAIRGTWD